ncbi:MAG: plastocyanin/azurin family copper-binding protein [Sphingobacteriaceae bacterium]
MKRLFYVSLISLPFFFASCGGNTSEKTETTTTTEESAAPADTASAQDIAREMSVKAIPGIDTVKLSNEINITGNDQMKFSANLFKVKAGETVTLNFKNIGTQPKKFMAHNVVILNQGADENAFAEAALAAKDNDYIPASLSSEIVKHTKLLGPGESDKITFTLTDKGAYHFFCSFPGHHTIMTGNIVAE